MAAANPLKNLQEEAMCPICLEHLTDPLSTPCGHNFCRPCIKACSEGPGAPFCCPQCREACSRADLRPNRQLQSMVELVKQLSVNPGGPPRGKGVCEQHEEKLKLYCQDDKKMICVICQVSREHEKHTVRPINEAAQEYQDKLQKQLPSLKKEREAIVFSKKNEEEDYKAMRKNLEEEKRKSMAVFERLRQLLKEQEQVMLTKLEEMSRKITMVENSNITKLSNQISSLDTLIKEITTKCKQPPDELLKDAGFTLNKCENVKFRGPEPMRKNKYMKKAPGNANRLNFGAVTRYHVLVTLDLETANHSLVLSENQSRVRHSGSEKYVLYDANQFWKQNTKRFTASACVLGREGFCSGRRYWEVEIIQDGQGWTVGVAEEAINRNFKTVPPQMHLAKWYNPPSIESPQRGIWALHVAHGQGFALTHPCTPVPLHHPIRKLGVFLDYEAGQVSLYNVDTTEVLYTFSGPTFSGAVYPYFNLSDAYCFSQPLFADLRLL